MQEQKKAPREVSGQTETFLGVENEVQIARIQRYSKAKMQAENLRMYIEETNGNYERKQRAELLRLYKGLCECGNYLLFYNFYTVGQMRLVAAHFCKKHLVCPLCAIRRGAKALRSYLERFEYLKTQNPRLQASLVTLTVQNGPDLLERLNHLQEGIKKANQRMRNARRRKSYSGEFKKFQGYVGSYEIKKGRNSGLWHPHVHMIVLHEDNLCRFALSKEWHQIMGDSFIVDVSPLHNPDNPAKDFCEVFKYALKFSSMIPKDVIYAYFVLSEKRLVFNGGYFGVQRFRKNSETTPLKICLISKCCTGTPMNTLVTR